MERAGKAERRLRFGSRKEITRTLLKSHSGVGAATALWLKHSQGKSHGGGRRFALPPQSIRGASALRHPAFSWRLRPSISYVLIGGVHVFMSLR